MQPVVKKEISDWPIALKELRVFRRERNRSLSLWKTGITQLHSWAYQLFYSPHRFTHKQLRQAHETGFYDRSKHQSWFTRYFLLEDFYKAHGHYVIPDPYPPDKNLCGWASRQRHFHLQPWKVTLLDRIHFRWELRKPRDFEVYLQKLDDFRRKYGHTQVSRGYSDKGLNGWVEYQKNLYCNGKLPPDKVRILQQHGFVFRVLEDSWNRRYRQLKNFMSVMVIAITAVEVPGVEILWHGG